MAVLVNDTPDSPQSQFSESNKPGCLQTNFKTFFIGHPACQHNNCIPYINLSRQTLIPRSSPSYFVLSCWINKLSEVTRGFSKLSVFQIHCHFPNQTTLQKYKSQQVFVKIATRCRPLSYRPRNPSIKQAICGETERLVCPISSQRSIRQIATYPPPVARKCRIYFWDPVGVSTGVLGSAAMPHLHTVLRSEKRIDRTQPNGGFIYSYLQCNTAENMTECIMTAGARRVAREQGEKPWFCFPLCSTRKRGPLYLNKSWRRISFSLNLKGSHKSLSAPFLGLNS